MAEQRRRGGLLFASESHNHQACVSGALAAAETLCADRGARLTALRRRVLELVWSRHRPLGAYAILAELQQEGPTAPPTVYRALEFLVDQGLVHRVNSLNAYIGCTRPQQTHSGFFLICAHCGDLAELVDETVSETLAQSAHRHGFTVQKQTVELMGLCPRCGAREN